MRPRVARLCVISSALLLASCTVGPNYKRPQLAIPDGFRTPPDAPPPATALSLADQKWFDLFHDDSLKTLVTAALAHNFDMGIAAERVLEARATLAIVQGSELPTVDATAQLNAGTASLVGSARNAPASRNTAYGNIFTTASWDLDLFGRLRRQTEAARATYLGTEEARRALTVSLIGETMNAWFSLLEQDLELSIATATRDIAQDNLRLTNIRHDRGAASALDVAQAQQLLYTATTQIASAQRVIGLTENALSLLAGDAPHSITRVTTLEQTPLPPELAAGLPSDLLTRRPDIRQAEQSLVAANARLGAARALLFPDISLTAFLGTQSRALTSLFTNPARTDGITPAVLLPVFRAGIRSGIHLTEAQQREALISYQKVIYTALRDVSDALIAHDRLRGQRVEQERLVGALNTTVNIATTRYKGGLDSYLQVLDAQRNLFAGQLSLARLRLNEVLSIVQLYSALGGGWQQ